MTLPEAMLKRKDILGAAETGSGKTLAFAIPIVASILEAEGNYCCYKYADLKIIRFNNILFRRKW